MRTETRIHEFYKFEELDDKAKEKAREWFRLGALDYEWWEAVYEDAERIGLKITSFDLDRSRHAKGKILTSCPEVAETILKEHGTMCQTNELAKEYLNELSDLDAKYPYENIKDRPEDYDVYREAMDDVFKKSLLEDYSITLQKEYEYQLSDEVVDENITANEYEFTKEGKRA